MKRLSWWLALAVLLVGTPLARAEESLIWGRPLTKTATASANATNTVIWTPVSGNIIVLMGCIFSAAGPADVTMSGSTDGTIMEKVRLQSGGIEKWGYGGNFPVWMSSTVDETLRFTIETSATLSITCSGYERQPLV